jgi:proteasome lid subunit RPN8/RPN11
MSSQGPDLPLGDDLREEIISHARDLAPRECCGIVSGRGGVPSVVHRLTNVEPGTTRYLFDDEEFYRVYRDLIDRGEELVCVYHSHPATPAYPSETDIAHAAWPEAIYLICSLQDQAAPDIRGFRLVDGDVTEVALT